MTMTHDEPPIYNQLATIRAERGLSRAELAHTLGIEPQLLGYIEQQKYRPDLALALRICTALEVPMERVFSLHPFEVDRGPRLV